MGSPDNSTFGTPGYKPPAILGDNSRNALKKGSDKAVAAMTPPQAPDLTDELVQQARIAARRRQMMGGGLASSFLTGPLGVSAPLPITKPTAQGL